MRLKGQFFCLYRKRKYKKKFSYTKFMYSIISNDFSGNSEYVIEDVREMFVVIDELI